MELSIKKSFIGVLKIGFLLGKAQDKENKMVKK